MNDHSSSILYKLKYITFKSPLEPEISELIGGVEVLFHNPRIFPQRGGKPGEFLLFAHEENGRAKFWTRGLGRAGHLLGPILGNNFQAC